MTLQPAFYGQREHTTVTVVTKLLHDGHLVVTHLSHDRHKCDVVEAHATIANVELTRSNNFNASKMPCN